MGDQGRTPYVRNMPTGMFSLAGVVIVFFWTWAAFYSLFGSNFWSFAAAVPCALLAGGLASFDLEIPILVQSLAYGLVIAYATFGLYTLHSTDKADGAGGFFLGALMLVLVAVDQSQVKTDRRTIRS